MHDVLVISSGIFHPPLLGRLHLWRVLGATPGVRLRPAGTVEALPRADACSLSAVVLYFHRKTTISPPALEALDRFARYGGGVLAVHSATASFKETPSYTDLLGGRFVGHPPVGPLEILPVPGADEIFDAIAPFKITDEAYQHELRDDIRVHFLARCLGSQPTVPIVWTRRHNAGRICYVGAGHCAASLRHPSMVRILQAGLAWACAATEETRS